MGPGKEIIVTEMGDKPRSNIELEKQEETYVIEERLKRRNVDLECSVRFRVFVVQTYISRISRLSRHFSRTTNN